MDAQLIAFDLDDTLAPSKSPLPAEMAELLTRLLHHVHVCVISGAAFSQFVEQFLNQLPDHVELGQLHLLPACGTQYFRFREGEWRCLYSEPLEPIERRAALSALEEEAKALGIWEEQTWGPILEDRSSQITFSGLGQAAPVQVKAGWDPSGSKRSSLVEALQSRLPGLCVRAGGSTSVDVTRRGIDKGYGIRRLAGVTGISIEDMIFVGDRLDPDGNDYPVRATGVRTQAVRDWHETAQYISNLLAPSFGTDHART